MVVEPPRSCRCSEHFRRPVSARHSALAGFWGEAQAAFSLIETTLAIGIVAFAFVALMGLLPVGLTTFRRAIDTSVGSQIFQRVMTDAEQTDFDVLIGQAQSTSDEFYTLPIRYFDEQGLEVTPKNKGALNAEESLRVVYHVRLRGSVPGPADVSSHGAGHFTSLPAAPSRSRFNPRATSFLTVQVANNPGNRPIPVNARFLWGAGDIPVNTFTGVLTRNGYSQAGP